MPNIEVRELSKRFGDLWALDELTLHAQAGDVLVLLGPNGAGKTTALRLMMSFLRPTRGSVTFDGAALTPKVLERIAYVPETSALYDDLTGADHVEWYRRSYRRFRLSLASNLSDRFSLDWKKRIRALAKGERTALSLILAFSTQPDILLLDEPTSGLDPVNQQAIKELIVGAAVAGSTVILSSHQVRNFEGVANSVAILQKGRLRLSGTIDDLKSEFRIVDVSIPRESRHTRLPDDARILSSERHDGLLRLVVRSNDDSLESKLAALGNIVQVKNLDLEQIFMKVIGAHELR